MQTPSANNVEAVGGTLKGWASVTRPSAVRLVGNTPVRNKAVRNRQRHTYGFTPPLQAREDTFCGSRPTLANMFQGGRKLQSRRLSIRAVAGAMQAMEAVPSHKSTSVRMQGFGRHRLQGLSKEDLLF